TRAPGIRPGAREADPSLQAAARREARAHRLGAGALHLHRERRGHDGEAAARSLLHQEPVAAARPVHHLRDREDGRPAPGTLMSARPLIVTAMTIVVEDYFHVSVFAGVVPRPHWEALESRVQRH